jgi:hypothetical protein
MEGVRKFLLPLVEDIFDRHKGFVAKYKGHHLLEVSVANQEQSEPKP